MLKYQPSRRLVVAVALVALVMFAMTVGGVGHHHATSSDANCSICLLTHQQVEQPRVVHRTPTLALVGPPVEPLKAGYVPSTTARRLPARAPPAL